MKPKGSQFTEVPWALNGIGSGPSPPTYPFAKAFNDDGEVIVLTGANALAEPARAATVKKAFDMVEKRNTVVT